MLPYDDCPDCYGWGYYMSEVSAYHNAYYITRVLCRCSASPTKAELRARLMQKKFAHSDVGWYI